MNQEYTFSEKNSANEAVKKFQGQGFKIEYKETDRVVLLRERRRIPWIVHILLIPISGLGLITGAIEAFAGPRRRRVQLILKNSTNAKDTPTDDLNNAMASSAVKTPSAKDPILEQYIIRYGDITGRKLYEARQSSR